MYAVDDNRVAKLYKAGASLQSLQAEYEKTRAIHAMGLPVPALLSRLEYEGRHGFVMERVKGSSMMDSLSYGEGSVSEYARMLAELQLSICSREVREGFYSQRELLRERIGNAPKLTEEERARILRSLDDMPDGDRVCHGDFHPGNILLSESGSVVIDWADASRGSPVCDIARTTLLFLGHIQGLSSDDSASDDMVRFCRTYLSCGLGADDSNRMEHRRWLPILAAARLSEGIEEQERWLLSVAREGVFLDNLLGSGLWL